MSEAGPTFCLQVLVPSFWKEKGEAEQYPQWLTSLRYTQVSIPGVLSENRVLPLPARTQQEPHTPGDSDAPPSASAL